MRGSDARAGELFAYVDLERRVPADHPLRVIRAVVNAALDELSGAFGQLYARLGRPSIPPENLLRALLLQAFYSPQDTFAVTLQRPDGSRIDIGFNAAVASLISRFRRSSGDERLQIKWVAWAAALVFLAAAYLLLTRLRDQGSRWFPLSGSVVLFATVSAIVVISTRSSPTRSCSTTSGTSG
jgi:hypothetical protein